MRTRYKVLAAVFAGMIIVGIAWFLLSRGDMPVLNTQGVIADKQRDLITFAVILSLIVIIPVYILLFAIAWRYRAGNTRAKYRPDWEGNTFLELIWWGIPLVIIGILSVVIWNTSHDLDPFKPIDSDKQPVNVQVVALQWKWLFLYPDHGVASVNELGLPVDTPINFTITADAPMNSFWLPSLGGQVYAMSGMSTKLHLMARTVGDYQGRSANISGKGFSGMTFVAHAQTDKGFEQWLQDARRGNRILDAVEYDKLRTPGNDYKKATYLLQDTKLYDTIVHKYMNNVTQPGTERGMEGMSH